MPGFAINSLCLAEVENNAAEFATNFVVNEDRYTRLQAAFGELSTFRSRRAALERFLTDGRIDIDSNIVEPAIRPQTIARNNALFAGSDGGGRPWATISTLLTSAKMNGVDPMPGSRRPCTASPAAGQTARSLTSCPGTSGHSGPATRLHKWDYAMRYTEHGRMALNIIRLEYDTRIVTTGRRSWLVSDTVDEGKASIVIYSLMFICRACGVAPLAWLRHVLSELPQRAVEADINDLLPSNFAKVATA